MDRSLTLFVLWSVIGAFISWRLAAKQGRNRKHWTLATVLLGGLPAIWLIISDLFAMPTFGTAVKHTCCENQSWTAIADFGHAGGVDLDLGKCENCGAYLMAVFYVSSTNYVVISREQADEFLALGDTPERKKALKNWVG